MTNSGEDVLTTAGALSAARSTVSGHPIAIAVIIAAAIIAAVPLNVGYT